MKRYLTLILLLSAHFCGLSQDPANNSFLNIAAINDSVNISAFASVYVDSTAAMTPAEVAKQRFIPLMDYKYRRSVPPEMVTYRFYLKFNVFNTTDSARSVYLYPGSMFADINLYKIGTSLQVIPNSENDGYRRMRLEAGEQATILVYLKFVKCETAFFYPHLVKASFIQNFKILMFSPRPEIKIFGYVASGVLLMMMLFMATNFLLSFRREFLYNTLYSFSMFLLVYLNSYCLKVLTQFSYFFFNYFDFFLLVIGMAFYISFTRAFLNAKSNYPLLDRTLKYGEISILVLLAVYSYINFFTGFFVVQVMLENIMKSFIMGIGVYFIVMALKQKAPLLNYLAAGNAALVIFSAISLALIWSDKRPTGLFSSPLFYYYIGIILELIFFMLGLTYKNRAELIERIKVEEAMKLEAEKKEYETQIITIMKAQQEERNRISADMHDDLGAGMTTIRLYSELAKNKLIDNPIPEIDKISSSSNELLNKMNAIIWSMSSSNDSLGNMIAYIRSYALEYFENTGVDCKISLPENLPNIEVIGEIRRNVFLVVKEALNNILKHAKATEVTITLERVPDGLTLFIHDNGVGIDFEKLRQFGNGLKNMKKRMDDIHIDFNIENKNGTLITLHRKIAGFNGEWPLK